jgi:aryl-alcohol dehydrogenase-like predicted oxidoreductase
MAQLALAWVLQNDNVASAITGASRPEQVRSNAAAAGRKLSPETMAGID